MFLDKLLWSKIVVFNDNLKTQTGLKQICRKIKIKIRNVENRNIYIIKVIIFIIIGT